jgi:hypothetical protein
MNKFIFKNVVIFGYALASQASVLASGQLTYSYMGRLNTPLQEGIGNQFVEVNASGEGDAKNLDFIYNGNFRHYPSANTQLYSISELYIKKTWGEHEVSLGRKVISWHKNDLFWALGEVNPLRGFNLIETNREGLMGLHYQWENKNFEVKFLGSALNIPQVNPTFTAENGKINGNNEWSYPPPQYVRYQGSDVPIYYILDYPDMEDIIVKPSLALSTFYNFDKGRLGVYGGYKPETGIRVNATGYYEQFAEERALVKARPFINNHYFWGGSVDYQLNQSEKSDAQWLTSVGVEGVVPELGTDEKFTFASLKIQPSYERLTYSTASLRFKSSFFEVGLNGMYLIDGDVIDENVFAKKPKWRQAIGLEGNWTPWRDFKISGLYRYDIKTQDFTLLGELAFLWTKHIGMTVGVQIINAPKDYSFWAPYRTNDSLFSRLSYIF